MAFTVEAPPVKTAPICGKLCGKGKKAKAGIKFNGFTVCVCAIDWIAFHNGPGFVKLDFQEQMDNINNNTPLKSLWFSSGFQGKVVGQGTPSWDIEALLGFDEVSTGASEADKWEVGFIQTVEKLIWTMKYDNGWVRKASAQGARDAHPAKTPAPWVTTQPGAKSRPVILDNMDQDHPTLADEPMVKASVVPPEADAWCVRINSVTVEGKFHLWLIASDTRKTLSMSDLVFMYHATIEMNKEWTLKAGGDPFSTFDWQTKGTQTKTDGFGKGTETPVLNTPIANQQMVVATSNQGTPCAKKPGGKP
jgi:hypothetical protein